MPTFNGNEQNNKPGDMNKTYTYIAVVIVVLAIIAWVIYARNHQNNAVDDNGSQAVQQGSPSNNLEATSTPTSTPASAVIAQKLSYGDAIKKYPNRFQFSQCQGTPSVIAIKKGSPVMLDNRDAVAHTIKADTQTFRLAGFGYAILYPQVLGNLPVTCDGKNRVMLNVEK